MKKVIFLLLAICSMFNGCKSSSTQEPPVVTPVKPPYAWTTFCMGVDLSYVNEIQDFGGVYSDSGMVADPFAILKKHGANSVRVRLWHNPAWVKELTGGAIYSDLYDAEKTIRRAKEAGMAVNLDVHYSDTWADAGHQETPAAWSGLATSVLKDSVYNYTLYVLNYLKGKGLTPEMVQVGNETNGGILYPSGQVTGNNWKPFADLLNAGIRAVRDFSAGSDIKPRIILHVAQLQYAGWWANGVIKLGGVTDFDIIGLSHYSKWSDMNGMDQVTQVIGSLKKAYGKQVMIVETAYAWTQENADTYGNIYSKSDMLFGYPLTPDGQQLYMQDLVQAVISGGGTGVMYWEPAWITSSMKDKWGTGSSWDNCTLFDFTGNGLVSMDYMKSTYKFYGWVKTFLNL